MFMNPLLSQKLLKSLTRTVTILCGLCSESDRYHEGGEGSFAKGGEVVSETLMEWGLIIWFSMRDGSGLSRWNLVTPVAVAGVFRYMADSPNYEMFFNSLPIAGVDGTLDGRFQKTRCQKRVFAKTGYINQVRALSGYLKAFNGNTYVFSIICNNYSTSTGFINRLQDQFCDLLLR